MFGLDELYELRGQMGAVVGLEADYGYDRLRPRLSAG
jgi:hypothetical protein